MYRRQHVPVSEASRRPPMDRKRHSHLFHTPSLFSPSFQNTNLHWAAMNFQRGIYENDVTADPWVMYCPLSPSAAKRPNRTAGYASGATWQNGRVELKCNSDIVDEQSKRLAQIAILQAYERLSQSILGEGLYNRSYTQLTACMDSSTNTLSPNRFECLGDSGEDSCVRIGTILPITTGYAIYGRIDNCQVLVQDPQAFATIMDELIDAKVSLLRQATVALGILARDRADWLQTLEKEYQQKIVSFEAYHKDVLVGHVSALPSSEDLTEILVEWESQRRDIDARWRYENKEKIMDIEHWYHCQRTSLFLGCHV